MHGGYEEHQIQDAYAEYGCNMRTLKAVLDAGSQDTSAKDRIRQKIRLLSLSDLDGMLDADTEFSSHASYSIILTHCIDQAQATQDGYERSGLTHRFVSCPAVWGALNDRHGTLLYSKLNLTTRLFQRVPETSFMAGYMWEAYSHARISAGGVFTLIPMTVEGTDLVSRYSMSESIMIGHLTRTKFITKDPPTSTQEVTKYYIPSASNNATFDAFLLSNSKQIALQTTVSSSHSLTSSGFDELTKRLPPGYEQCFAFVVPNSTAWTFKCKPPDGPVQQRFKFFLLLLDQDNSKYCPSSAQIVDIDDEMIEDEALVHAGSKSAYSWWYHLLSTYQNAGGRMRMRLSMSIHKAPQPLRNLGRRRQGEDRMETTRHRSAPKQGRSRMERERGGSSRGAVIDCCGSALQLLVVTG